MNKVSLVGRLTKAPELKETNSQNKFSTFTLAVNRNYKNKDGKVDADFINCVAHGKSAENLVKFCGKGRLVAVSGSINTSTYEDQNGNKKYATNIRVDNIEFLESGRTSTEVKTVEEMSNSEIIQQVMTEEDPFKEFGAQMSINDDDLPF